MHVILILCSRLLTVPWRYAFFELSLTWPVFCHDPISDKLYIHHDLQTTCTMGFDTHIRRGHRSKSCQILIHPSPFNLLSSRFWSHHILQHPRGKLLIHPPYIFPSKFLFSYQCQLGSLADSTSITITVALVKSQQPDSFSSPPSGPSCSPRCLSGCF